MLGEQQGNMYPFWGGTSGEDASASVGGKFQFLGQEDP